MAGRYKQVDYLLRRRFPAYVDAVRAALTEEIRNHKGEPDISDIVVDAVRSRFDLDSEDLWPDEARRLAAEAALHAEFGSNPADQQERERWRRFIDEARNYEADLLDASDDDLFSQYNAEKDEEQAEVEAEAVAKERWAIFNERHATADFSYWLEMPTWTLGEAVALSLGKDPRVVTRDAIGRELGIRKSPFARSFDERWERISRAMTLELFNKGDHIFPERFISWARRSGIAFPEHLQPVMVDQNDNTDEHEAESTAAELESKLRAASDTEKLEILRKEVRILRRRLGTEKSARSKEYKKTVEILFAVTYYAYGYNPLSPSLLAIKSIVDNAKNDLKIHMSDDTVQAKLWDAYTELSEDTKAILKDALKKR